MKEGHIFTEGAITPEYPEQIAAQIARVGEVDKYIHHVSSPGGDVIAGYKGYHKLVALGKPIDSIVEGEAQSMGSFIIMASNATGGKIKILNPSRVMIHNPKFKVDGLATSGFADSDSLQSGADELKTIEQEMAEVYANATKVRGKEKSVDEIKAMMKKETFMSAQDAVALGFADEVIKMVNREENSKLKAVALGTQGNNTMGKEKGILARLGEMLIKADVSPTAVDVPLKDGGMLKVEGDTMMVDAKASIEGQPADGEYVLDNGQTVICKEGVITEIKDAAPPEPQETEAQKLARENEQLKAQLLQKSQAEKTATENAQKAAAEEAAKQKAEEEKSKVAETLAKVEKELQALKNKTFGIDDKQSEGMEANRAVAIGGQFKDKMQIMATRSYLADNLAWLENTEHFQKKYPGGKFSDGTRFSDYRSGGPCAVSILETNLNYTWNGILSTDLFFKPTLSSPALGDIFTIDLGASDKKRYHIAPVANKILKPYTGCDQAVTGTSLNITSKPIQLKPFEMYEGWCKDDFTDQLTGSYNVLAQEWLKTGVDSFDPAGTPIDRMIIQLLKDGLRRDVFRRVSYADIDSSSADWNQFDGLWPSLIGQSGAQSNYCVYRETSVTLGNGALASDAALNWMKAAYKNSSNLLKEYVIDSGSGEWLVTRSFWENYYDSLVAAGSVSEAEYENLQNGIKKLMYKGIPLKPITIWDDFLADSTNPLFGTSKHMAMLTSKNNHILGVENSADLNKIDSWFEKKDNKRYYRSNMILGFLGAIHCDLTTIGY